MLTIYDHEILLQAGNFLSLLPLKFWKSFLQLFGSVEAYPYAENQHHNSIQSWHIVDLILRINLEGPCVPDHNYINRLNQIDAFVYA